MNRRQSVLGGVALMLGAGVEARAETLNLAGARIALEIRGEADAAMTALIRRWVAQSAEAVRVYYGKFPVPEVTIRVELEAGRGVRGGQTFPGDPPLIRMRAGSGSADDAFLVRDWVMVHEMIHLAFPWMDGAHNWMAEGLAVYVESIARVQAGHVKPAEIFTDFRASMPKGLPGPNDRGIDRTTTWGRTYWGGALFCLMADIAIREATGLARGLQHALRAINAERDFRREWDFRETLALGDVATGTRVLSELYLAWAETPVSPDLDGLWRDLGVAPESDAARLDAVRRAILTPIPS